MLFIKCLSFSSASLNHKLDQLHCWVSIFLSICNNFGILPDVVRCVFIVHVQHCLNIFSNLDHQNPLCDMVLILAAFFFWAIIISFKAIQAAVFKISLWPSLKPIKFATQPILFSNNKLIFCSIDRILRK